MSEVRFGYGVLIDPLAEQATAQGYTLKNADRYEKQREAINVLMFGDILTDSQVDKAFQRLQKHLIKDLVPNE